MGHRSAIELDSSRNGDFGLSRQERPAPTGRLLLAGWFVCAVVAMDFNLGGVSSRLGIGLLTNAGNALWLGVTFALVLHSWGRDENAGFRAKLLIHDWVYVLWLGVIGTSILWSVSPSTSLKEFVPLALVWFATLFLCRLQTADVVRLVVLAAIVIAALSLLVVPLDSALAYQPVSSTGSPELRGVFRHQLRLGAFMALALGLLILARMNGDLGRVRSKSSMVNVACVVLLVVVCVLSRARGYTGEAAIALVLTLLLSRRGAKKWLVMLIGSVAALGIVGRFNTLMTDLEEAGFDTEMTGRAKVWDWTLSGVTEESFLFGHGFGSLQLSVFDHLFPTGYRAGHAHNSYIQALFESGLIGLLALIALVVVQLVVAWRHSVRCNTYSYSLFLVLFTAIGSLTGLNYAGPLSVMFCLTMLFLAIESRAMPQADKVQEKREVVTSDGNRRWNGRGVQRR